MRARRVLCWSASLLVVSLLIGAVEVRGCITCLRRSQRLAFRAQPSTRTASLRFVSHADASALTGRQAAPARTRQV